MKAYKFLWCVFRFSILHPFSDVLIDTEARCFDAHYIDVKSVNRIDARTAGDNEYHLVIYPDTDCTHFDERD